MPSRDLIEDIAANFRGVGSPMKQTDLLCCPLPFEAHVRVLGGLPLTVMYSWEQADPSVGLEATVDDWALFDRRGRRATWAENRMDDAEYQRLHILIADAHAAREPQEREYDRADDPRYWGE